MNKKQLEKRIEEYYKKWSESGLNVYEKIALEKLEKEYKNK